MFICVYVCVMFVCVRECRFLCVSCLYFLESRNLVQRSLAALPGDGVIKTWNRRWFALLGPILFYFKDEFVCVQFPSLSALLHRSMLTSAVGFLFPCAVAVLLRSAFFTELQAQGGDQCG